MKLKGSEEILEYRIEERAKEKSNTNKDMPQIDEVIKVGWDIIKLLSAFVIVCLFLGWEIASTLFMLFIVCMAISDAGGL